MKTNRLTILVILFITGSFCVNISAKEALQAIAKKCETIDNIECNIVRSRDRKTQKVTHYMMRFKFSKNEALKKEILEAFEKDKGTAIRESIQKKDGLMNITYFFTNGQYSFKEEENGDMIFTARDYFSEKDAIGFIDNSIEGIVPFVFPEYSYRAKAMVERSKERMKERAKAEERSKERAKAIKERLQERERVKIIEKKEKT